MLKRMFMKCNGISNSTGQTSFNDENSNQSEEDSEPYKSDTKDVTTFFLRLDDLLLSLKFSNEFEPLANRFPLSISVSFFVLPSLKNRNHN